MATSLSSVVSNLVRASMGSSVSSKVTDDDLDRHVAELILKEAKKKAERYGQHGIRAFLPNNGLSDTNAPRANKRFLSSIIKSTDDHNKTILRAQALAAQEIKREREEQERRERRRRAEEAVEAEKRRRNGKHSSHWHQRRRRRTRNSSEDRERGEDEEESWDRWDGRTADRKRRVRHWESWDGEDQDDQDVEKEEDQDEEVGRSRRKRRYRSESRGYRGDREKRSRSGSIRESHRPDESRLRRRDHSREGRRKEERYSRGRSCSSVSDEDSRHDSKHSRGHRRSRHHRGHKYRRHSPSSSRSRSLSRSVTRTDGSSSRRHGTKRYALDDIDPDPSLHSRHHSPRRSPSAHSIEHEVAVATAAAVAAVTREAELRQQLASAAPTTIATGRSSVKRPASPVTQSRSSSPKSKRHKADSASSRTGVRNNATTTTTITPSRSRTLSRSRSRSRSRSPTLGPTPPPLPPPPSVPPPAVPPPPPVQPPSKMDKYFEESYDPRLDVAPLTVPSVPATGLIDNAAFEGWDAMLELIKQRKEDKEEKRRMERLGLLPKDKGGKVNKKKVVGLSDPVGERWAAEGVTVMDISYKSRGSVREWDLGKEGF